MEGGGWGGGETVCPQLGTCLDVKEAYNRQHVKGVLLENHVCPREETFKHYPYHYDTTKNNAGTPARDANHIDYSDTNTNPSFRRMGFIGGWVVLMGYL